MGTTDKIHDALSAADAPLFAWDARPLGGFTAPETRDEGWKGHKALSDLIIEATIARDRLAAELVEAGHTPLASAAGSTHTEGPPFPAADHVVRPGNTARMAGH